MRVKILSVLIPALLVAGTTQAAEIYNKNANKLDLYGRVDGLHYFSKDKGNDGDQSYARLGIKGETQISQQLTGYGQWEAQLNFNHPEGDSQNNIVTRVGYAGLRFGNLGSLDYGRNYGVVYDITSYTDMLPEFGGDTYGTDNFMQSRIGGALTYRNDNFFGLVNGLHFALQYQGKNDFSNVLKQNGDGFAIAASYDIPFVQGLTIGGALSNSKRTDNQNNYKLASLAGHGDKAETYTAGIKYDAHNVYLAAHYTQTYNATRFGDSTSTSPDNIYGFANKANNFEVVAQYQFDFGLVPSLAYLQSRGHNISAKYGDQDLLKYVDVGATYYFNKNMKAYVDYKINLLKDNEFIRNSGISKDNIVALGMVYQF